MAPAAVEIAPVLPTPSPDLKLHSTLNNYETKHYRGLFRSGFDKEAEQGNKKFPPAKVGLKAFFGP